MLFMAPVLYLTYQQCHIENGDHLISNATLVSSILLALASCAVYFHIFILTSLSKSETTREFLRVKNVLNIQKIQITYLIFLLISLSLAIILIPFKLDFLIFILFFLFLINLLFNRASKMDNTQGEISDKIHGQTHVNSAYNTRFSIHSWRSWFTQLGQL